MVVIHKILRTRTWFYYPQRDLFAHTGTLIIGFCLIDFIWATLIDLALFWEITVILAGTGVAALLAGK